MHPTPIITILAGILTGGSAALAGSNLVAFPVPSLDRWNYPFNSVPGGRNAASTFGAVDAGEIQGFTFDDRDGQLLIGWDLTPMIPAEPCPEDFEVTLAEVTLTVVSDLQFVYDPTYDTAFSYVMPSDPDFVADSDPGRPVTLFGVDYRNGFDAASFQENSPYGPVQRGQRNVFPVDFDAMGVARDVSNNIAGDPNGQAPTSTFEVNPWAVGRTDVTPGDLVPFETQMAFTLDVADPAIQGYLKDAIAGGELRVMVTSLQPATFAGMTGSFAAFYTKENIFGMGNTATLELSIQCVNADNACTFDFNNDGQVDGADFGTFGAAFGSVAGDASYLAQADSNNDGQIDGADFGAFGAEFGRTDCLD
jgi:hypothetical protein